MDAKDSAGRKLLYGTRHKMIDEVQELGVMPAHHRRFNRIIDILYNFHQLLDIGSVEGINHFDFPGREPCFSGDRPGGIQRPLRGA